MRKGAGLLHIEQLHKAYDCVTALDEVDLEIAGGEIVGLLGPHGAGKTTVVSIVAGLRRADAGSVHVDGIGANVGSPVPTAVPSSCITRRANTTRTPS